MVSVIVNDEHVGFDYGLENKDRVRIITDPLSSGPKEEWMDIATTTHAKEKIKSYIRK